MAKPKKKTAGRTRGNSQGSIWTDPKTGSLYAVVTWSETGPDGKPKRKRKTERAPSGTRTEAYEMIPELKRKAEAERRAREGTTAIVEVPAGAAKKRNVKPDRITFAELATYHKQDNLIPVRRNDEDVKICGLASWKDARHKVDTLVQYFGPATLVCSLTRAQVKKYRTTRLLAPPVTTYKLKGSKQMVTRPMLEATGEVRQRAVASVHRELSALRRMVNYAFEEGWLSVPPIRSWKDLINPGEEKARTTIATRPAEELLLAQCDTDPKRRHLKPYLLAGFDTGCRSIELRRLLVKDVNFETNKFVVYSDKGKRRHWRDFVMTPRVREALLECCQDKQPTDHVFTYGKHQKKPLTYAPRKSFASAKRQAGAAGADLSGFRGHDMRHTMITRAVESGVPLAEVAKYAGHRQPSTTWRYVNPGEASQIRIAEVMANYTEAPNKVLTFAKRKRKKSA